MRENKGLAGKNLAGKRFAGRNGRARNLRPPGFGARTEPSGPFYGPEGGAELFETRLGRGGASPAGSRAKSAPCDAERNGPALAGSPPEDSFGMRSRQAAHHYRRTASALPTHASGQIGGACGLKLAYSSSPACVSSPFLSLDVPPILEATTAT